MSNSEIVRTICGGLFGLSIFIAFLLMFGWAVWKGEFIFHYGRIRGRLARAIGVIGLLGMAAGTYLVINSSMFEGKLPFASFAGFFVGLLLVFLFIVRILSLFFWHSE